MTKEFVNEVLDVGSVYNYGESLTKDDLYDIIHRMIYMNEEKEETFYFYISPKLFDDLTKIDPKLNLSTKSIFIEGIKVVLIISHTTKKGLLVHTKENPKAKNSIVIK